MSPKRLARILWLLPAIFIVHDTEELLTIPGWLALHRLDLERMAERNALAASLVHTLATTTPQVAVGIGFLLIVFVAVTAAASASLRRGPALYIYASLLGILFLHVHSHIGEGILFRGYSPGVITAILVIIPGALIIYRALFQASLLTPKSAVISALAGLLFFIPGLLLAHQLGR